MDYTLNSKLSGNTTTTFVNFADGSFARVVSFEKRGFKAPTYHLKSITGNYDKKNICVSMGRLGEVIITKISSKKMVGTLTHKFWGKCTLVARNENGTITIDTDNGRKTVLEKFFMNKIISE